MYLMSPAALMLYLQEELGITTTSFAEALVDMGMAVSRT